MQTTLKLKPVFSALFLLLCLAFTGCKEDEALATLDAQQLVAGRLGGTWAKPTNILTPEGVPSEVFGAMRLLLTVDESGNPSQFLAKDCPIIFGATTGTWTVAGTQDDANIKLTGVTPVDEFKAQVSSNSLTISFHMGWENTDTGVKGQGDFRVTLSRQ